MDGLESCRRIYNYLHSVDDEQSPKIMIYSQQSISKQKSPHHGTQHFTPLIYALTGEESSESVKRIMQFPFEKVLNKIGVEEIEIFLKKIKTKRSYFTAPAVEI